MIDIDDKLDEKLRQQRDGQLEEDEELQLRFIANPMPYARIPSLY